MIIQSVFVQEQSCMMIDTILEDKVIKQVMSEVILSGMKVILIESRATTGQVNRRQSHKASYVRSNSVWNEGDSHRVQSHNRTSEWISSHKSDEKNEEKYPMSVREVITDNSCPFYKDLCISYIPSRISNSDLEDGLLIEFEKYGRVSVKIINEDVNRRAYVRFSQPDEAERAFKSIEEHPLLLDGRKVEVVPCLKKVICLDQLSVSVNKLKRRSPSYTDTFRQPDHIPHDLRSTASYNKRSISPKAIKPEYDAAMYGSKDSNGEENVYHASKAESNAPTRVLFVGNLQSDIKKQVLESVFESYGKIEDIDIKHSTHQAFSKTFAFIKFSHIHSALKAKKELHHSYVGVNRCNIGFGQLDADILKEKQTEELKSSNSGQWRSLLVRKIPTHLVVSHLYEILQEIFEGFGSMNVKITTLDDERVAYINFQYPKEAQAAFESNQNLILGGQHVEVTPISKSDADQQDECLYKTGHKSVEHVDLHKTNDKNKPHVHERYCKSRTPTEVLFVRHLSSYITKDHLKHTFEKFGSITDIDIEKMKFGHNLEKTEFGHKSALIRFQSVQSSKNAYNEMLGKKIGKFICKLEYSRPIEEADKYGNRKQKAIVKAPEKASEKKDQIIALCISEIPPNVQNYRLRRILGKKYKRFTKEKSLLIQIKMSGKDRIAYVNFKHPCDAKNAFNAKIPLKMMNKYVKIAAVKSLTEINDKPCAAACNIKEDIVASGEEILEPELDEKATRTLFVGNLPFQITEKEVRQKFEEYGKIEFVAIKRTNNHRSYAFVTYINMDYAYKAKVEMNGQIFKDYKINIGYGKASVTSCLWVGGLGSWVDAETFKQEFSRFGEIRRIVWPKGSNFAYVQYEDNAAAEAACHKLHGWPMGGLDKRLKVDFVSVNQILTARDQNEKIESKHDPAEDYSEPDDEDDNKDQSDAESKGSVESDIALSKSFVSDKSLESETALTTSSISENSFPKFPKDYDASRSPSPNLTKSAKSSSHASSVHSQMSNDVAVDDEESGIWARPSEDCLIIKTPFSPIDDLSQRQAERTVFVQPKENINDFNYHGHEQTHQRKHSPDTSYRRACESLQQDIQQYRRESDIPKHLPDLYGLPKHVPNSPDLPKHFPGSTDVPKHFPDSCQNMYDRSRDTDSVYRRVPVFTRDNADQYRQSPVLKNFANNEEYEKRNENQEHKGSDVIRMNFLEPDRKSLSNQDMSNDLRKPNIVGRNYQEIYEKQYQESTSGYSDKSTRNRNADHGQPQESLREYAYKSISNRGTEHWHSVTNHSQETFAGYFDKSTRHKDTEQQHGMKHYSRESFPEYSDKSIRNSDVEYRHGVKKHSQESFPVYSDKSTRYVDHDSKNGISSTSRVREHSESYPVEANVTVPQKVLDLNRSLQYENRSGSATQFLNKPVRESVASDQSHVSGSAWSSYELPKVVNTLPSHGSIPSDFINSLINFGVRQPTMQSSAIQKPPISYGDKACGTRQTLGNTLQQPFGQTLPEHIFPFHGSVSTSYSTPRINMTNVPRMRAPMQTPSFQVEQFPQRFVQDNTTRPAVPPVSFSSINSPDIVQHSPASSTERIYPMMPQPRTQHNFKGTGALPWHIQQ